MKTKSHRRKLLIVGTIFSLITSNLFASPASAVPNEWIIVGSGWGHGVGLSQYGALGQEELISAIPNGYSSANRIVIDV